MGIARTWRLRRSPGTPSTVALAAVGALALVVVGLAWTLASPIAASPDDDFHLGTIWCEKDDPAFCRRTGRTAVGDGPRAADHVAPRRYVASLD